MTYQCQSCYSKFDEEDVSESWGGDLQCPQCGSFDVEELDNLDLDDEDSEDTGDTYYDEDGMIEC